MSLQYLNQKPRKRDKRKPTGLLRRELTGRQAALVVLFLALTAMLGYIAVTYIPRQIAGALQGMEARREAQPVLTRKGPVPSGLLSAAGPWPTTHGTVGGGFCGQGLGGVPGRLLWRADLPYNLVNGPVVGADGSLVIETFLGRDFATRPGLAQLDPDGHLVWQIDFAGLADARVVTQEGDVLIAGEKPNTGDSDETVARLGPDGAFRWTWHRRLRSGPYTGTFFAVDASNAVITPGGLFLVPMPDGLWAFRGDGQARRISADTEACGIPTDLALGPAGRIYLSARERGTLACLNENGTRLWLRRFSGRLRSPVAVASDGSLRLMTPNSLLCLSPDGRTRWEYPLPAGGPNGSLALLPGDCTAAGFGSEITCVGPDGKKKWTHTVPSSAPNQTLFLAASADGYLYAVVYPECRVLATFSPEGEEAGQIALDGLFPGFAVGDMAVGDGRLYLTLSWWPDRMSGQPANPTSAAKPAVAAFELYRPNAQKTRPPSSKRVSGKR